MLGDCLGNGSCPLSSAAERPQRLPVPPQQGSGSRSVGRRWGVTGHAVGALPSPPASTCHFAPSRAPRSSTRRSLLVAAGQTRGRGKKTRRCITQLRPVASLSTHGACHSVGEITRHHNHHHSHHSYQFFPSCIGCRVATRGPPIHADGESQEQTHTHTQPNPADWPGPQVARAPSSHRSMRMHHSRPADARQGPAAQRFERHRGGLRLLAASAA